ncbi:MAG: TolC family protein, partial [Gemmatimonadales bacterium]|nr:TolC family protein [Gemmatimonadales bacterium]
HRRVRDRVTAGAVSPIEETRAGVALATAQVEAQRALRTLEAARRGLAALWGASEATFAGVTGVLDVAATLPRFEALATRLGENPAVARSTVEVLRQRAVLSAAGAQRVPDLTLTGGVRRFPDLGSSALVLGGSLALPLFDQNGNAITAARHRVERAMAEQRDVEARVSAELAQAYSVLSAAREEASMLRAAVVPGAERAFAAVSEGYRLGRFGYLEVLDAQRTLIAANTPYLRALAEYTKAVADVEQIIGMPLETVPVVPR